MLPERHRGAGGDGADATHGCRLPLGTGATAGGVVMVPPGRSADLRRYYAKHSKTDRLDSQLLAGLPILRADGPHLIMKALNVRGFPVAISPVMGEDM